MIHFESAAVGDMDIEGGNPVRIETAEAAVDLDARLRAVWSGHPRFVMVPHNPSFFKKITFGLASIESIVSQLRAHHRDQQNGAPPSEGLEDGDVPAERPENRQQHP